MMGTKKLAGVAEDGIAAVKKADTSVKVVIALAAITLVASLVTFALVLASVVGRG